MQDNAIKEKIEKIKYRVCLCCGGFGVKFQPKTRFQLNTFVFIGVNSKARLSKFCETDLYLKR